MEKDKPKCVLHVKSAVGIVVSRVAFSYRWDVSNHRFENSLEIDTLGIIGAGSEPGQIRFRSRGAEYPIYMERDPVGGGEVRRIAGGAMRFYSRDRFVFNLAADLVEQFRRDPDCTLMRVEAGGYKTTLSPQFTRACLESYFPASESNDPIIIEHMLEKGATGDSKPWNLMGYGFRMLFR
jgi:hypothetical protein